MDYEDYLIKVRNNFNNYEIINLKEKYTTTLFYEEVFKWKWFATKLKISSYIRHVKEINRENIEKYSEICFKYSIKHTGSLRGVQQGVLSNSILVSEKVSNDAIAFTKEKPEKHFAVFKMPIVYDLSISKIQYFDRTITWGKVYESFFKDYIEEKFNII